MSNRRAIVLLSGGLDSAVTLYLARERGFRCDCLAFDYGQRHRRELASAKKIARAARCPLALIKINLPWKGSALFKRSGSLPLFKGGRGVNSIPATYVPGRNIIFLSFALSCAEAKKAGAIFIGAHDQDYSGYPDCRPEFFRAFSAAAAKGTKTGLAGKPVQVIAPLLGKDKSGIIRLGRRLGVPFHLSWSCYRGGRRPCGKCDSCHFRARGFSEAGIRDSLINQ